jgi:hypothetical protein
VELRWLLVSINKYYLLACGKKATYHPLKSNFVTLTNTIKIYRRIQFERISNLNPRKATEVRDWPVQAFMESRKELNIVEILQSLSNRLLHPFISDISSQHTRHIHFLARLNRSGQLDRLRGNGLQELGTLNEEMYGSRLRRRHASNISNANVVNHKVLAGFIDAVLVLINNVKIDNLKDIYTWVGRLR